MTPTILTPSDIKTRSQQFRSSLRPLPDRPLHLADDAIDPTVKFGSEAERQFAMLWCELFPAIDLYTQYVFHPKRRFSIDFFQPDAMVGIEIQGAVFSRGKTGHNSGKGLTNDYEKQRIAAEVGIHIISVPSHQIKDGKILRSIAEIIKTKMINVA